MIQKIIISVLLTFLLGSCGLTYVSPPTPISQSADRRDSIQVYLKNNFETDSAKYESIAFGKTITLKPLSYKELDSLYDLKYRLELQNKIDRNLEDQIQIQRQIALNDTNTVIFIENHLFSITRAGKAEVYSATFEVTPNYKIRNVIINESNMIEEGNMDYFKIYSFQESFITPGFTASPEEQNFYALFRPEEQRLIADEKDAFLNHTIHVMKTANTIKTVKKTTLIKELCREFLSKKGHEKRLNEDFESMEETLDNTQEPAVVNGYQVVCSFQETKDGLNYTHRYIIKLDEFYRIKSGKLF